MSRFNKSDRVTVSQTSHSPYRGQTGVVDDIHPSSGSGDTWYTVRFDYKGLHPAARFMEEELEDAAGETPREATPSATKLARWSLGDSGNQVAQVSSRKKYYLSALVVVLALAGILAAVLTMGRNDTTTTPAEFSSSPADIPSTAAGSSNQTARLAFATELVESVAGSAFPVQPAVKIVDKDGNIMTGSTAPVTLAVTNNRATLYGTTTVNAVNGIAAFTDLTIGLAGYNYSLTAISPGLTSSLSNSFNVGPGEGYFLDFAVEPVSSGLDKRFSVKVVVRDAYGNLATGSEAEVTLSITPGTGPEGAVLSGTTTQRAEKGIATFNYLALSPDKSNYKLTASSPGLEPDTSYSFNAEKVSELPESEQ